VAVFTPLLPLALLGARHVAAPMRWTLLLLAAGSLAVPIFVGYAHSVDMVKFSIMALFALGILAGVELTRLTFDARPSRRALFGLALIGTTMTTVVLISGIIWAQFTHIEDLATYFEGPVSLQTADRHAIAWASSPGWTGRNHLPQAGHRSGVHATRRLVGHSGSEKHGPVRSSGWSCETAEILLEDPPPTLEPYTELGIVWFVSSPDDPRMEKNILRWTQAGQLVKEAEFGRLGVYKVVGVASGEATIAFQLTRVNWPAHDHRCRPAPEALGLPSVEHLVIYRKIGKDAS